MFTIKRRITDRWKWERDSHGKKRVFTTRRQVRRFCRNRLFGFEDEPGDKTVIGWRGGEVSPWMNHKPCTYDHTCRSAAVPGPGGFLHGLSVQMHEDDHVDAYFKARQLDLICKILEGFGSEERMVEMFHKAFDVLQVAQSRTRNEPNEEVEIDLQS